MTLGFMERCFEVSAWGLDTPQPPDLAKGAGPSSSSPGNCSFLTEDKNSHLWNSYLMCQTLCTILFASERVSLLGWPETKSQDKCDGLSRMLISGKLIGVNGK